MLSASESESSSPGPQNRPEADTLKSRLEQEKLQQELRELRRPYVLRNPQLLTALITSIGAIFGVFLLLQGNYFNVREERNRLQEQQTKQVDAEARRAKEAADKARDEAAAVSAAAEKAKAEATKIVTEAKARIKVSTDMLNAARRRLSDVQRTTESLELAVKAQEAVRRHDADAAQKAAMSAWRSQRTDEAKRALVSAFSLPVARLTVKGVSTLLGLSPDGQSLVTAHDTDDAQVWSVSSGVVVTTLKGSGYVGGRRSIVFSPDGRKIVVGARGGAHVWDARTGKALMTLDPSVSVTAVGFSRNGKKLATIGTEGKVWDASSPDVATWRPLFKLESSNGGETVAFTDDAERVVAHARASVSTTTVWDARTGKRLVKKAHPSSLLSQDGRYVLLFQIDGTLTVQDVMNDQVILKMEKVLSDMRNIGFDGLRILAARYESPIFVWDIHGKHLTTLETAPSLEIYGMRAHAGRRVAVLAATRGAEEVLLFDVVSPDDVETVFAERAP